MQIETIELEDIPIIETRRERSLAGFQRMEPEALEVLKIFGREAPKRKPLDWRDNPPDVIPHYDADYIREETDYLDRTFKRLCEKSPTFRALLQTKHVGDYSAIVDVTRTIAGALNGKYGEIEFGAGAQGSEHLETIALWVWAHEYRHAWQTERNASMQNHSDALPDFMALSRAMEADANACAATCVYEVLEAEGKSWTEIIVSMDSWNAMSWIMGAFGLSVYKNPESLKSGAAAMEAFKTFFGEKNAEALAFYDKQLIDIFNAAGGVRSLLTIVGSQHSKPKERTWDRRIAAMGSMPFIDGENIIVKRNEYRLGSMASFCLEKAAMDNKPVMRAFGISLP